MCFVSSTWNFQAVSWPSYNQAQCCLTSVFDWELVFPTCLGPLTLARVLNWYGLLIRSLSLVRWLRPILLSPRHPQVLDPGTSSLTRARTSSTPSMSSSPCWRFSSNDFKLSWALLNKTYSSHFWCYFLASPTGVGVQGGCLFIIRELRQDLRLC